jgi:hypothetical protein
MIASTTRTCEPHFAPDARAGLQRGPLARWIEMDATVIASVETRTSEARNAAAVRVDDKPTLAAGRLTPVRSNFYGSGPAVCVQLSTKGWPADFFPS